jgi:hypothetical protein
MSDVCCNLKQVERANGSEVGRCVNPKSKEFLTIVEDNTCGGCPVRALCKSSKPPQVHHAIIAPGYPEPCEHRIQEGFEIRCSVTGLPVTPGQCGDCHLETKTYMATLPDKLFGYASAVKKWIAAGRPTRTEDEVKAIFEDHCSKCEMYDKEKHACKSCGCSLATTGNPLINKLAMGTEKCPLGRWK